jgi:hypothetical protein
LLLDGQKDKASYYTSKAILYLPMISDPSEKSRLEKSFEALM